MPRQPGQIAPHSTTAKLAALDVGEVVMLDHDPSGQHAASALERHMTGNAKTSIALQGRRFTTRRVQWIDGDHLRHALRIKREE